MKHTRFTECKQNFFFQYTLYVSICLDSPILSLELNAVTLRYFKCGRCFSYLYQLSMIKVFSKYIKSWHMFCLPVCFIVCYLPFICVICIFEIQLVISESNSIVDSSTKLLPDAFTWTCWMSMFWSFEWNVMFMTILVNKHFWYFHMSKK